jgi:YHS domain-containing protein
MTGPTPLERKLEALLEDASKRRSIRVDAMMSDMKITEQRFAVYDQVARDCMTTLVLPRLETLIRVLGNGSPLEVGEKCDRITVTFYSTKQFPIGADISVFVALDPKVQDLLLQWKVSIIPILIDYEQEASAATSLVAPDWAALGTFLDERVVRFLSDYLRVHEPDSPYLRIERVTDPVCGMTMPRSEAAGCTEHKEHTYYFCIEACRDLFLKDPDRYLMTVFR